MPIEFFPNSTDTSIHHITGRNAVGTGFGVSDCDFGNALSSSMVAPMV